MTRTHDTLGNPGTLSGPVYQIQQQDGRTIESNLFHSFERFNLSTGEIARFESDSNIRTILSRVTGRSLSSIDGLIETLQPEVSLFLINPNGIVFGRNARLSVGRSFVATTADAVGFGDRGIFSATVPNAPSPLLTIAPSALLFSQRNSGSIIARNTPLLNENLPAAIAPNIFLIGGDVVLNRVSLFAPGGNVVLGGLAGEGVIQLRRGGQIIFPDSSFRANVLLKSDTHIDTSTNNLASDPATESGEISIFGNAVTLNRATLSTINQDGRSGDIYIHALGSVSLIGSDLSASQRGRGDSGNISITANDIYLEDRSSVQTGLSSILAIGTSGNITLNAKHVIQLLDSDISSSATGLGRGGNIFLNAGSIISLEDSERSGNIDSAADNGRAGNIRLRSQGSLLLKGFTLRNGSGAGVAGNILLSATHGVQIQDESNIVSDTGPGALSGSISLRTSGNLLINQGSVVSTRTTGERAGGTIQINAVELYLLEDAKITTSAFRSGRAGDVVLDVVNRIRLNGAETEISSNTQPGSTGDGGNIQIGRGGGSLDSVLLQDGARVTVSSNGQGRAGSLTVNANTLSLQNQARLFAATVGGEGGTIQLNLNDLLILSGGSRISAEAGSIASELRGSGGNVRIRSPLVVAASASPGTDGNDIQANAFQGTGGQITIRTQGIFGLEERRAIPGNGTNDIDASSEFGPSGTVTIARLGADPTQGLTELPSQPVDVSRLIARGCGTAGTATALAQREFVVSGRGGLPAAPGDVQGGEVVAAGWADQGLGVGLILYPDDLW